MISVKDQIARLNGSLHQYNQTPVSPPVPKNAPPTNASQGFNFGILQIEKDQTKAKIEELSKEVLRLKEETKKHPALKIDPNHILKRKITKARLGLLHDVLPQSTQEGAHLSCFMLNVKMRRVGVFKQAGRKAGVGIFNIYGWRGFLGVGQKSLLNKGTYIQLACERAAYLIKTKMAIPYFEVPPATLARFTKSSGEVEEVGAFLVFCKKVGLAKAHHEILHKKSKDDYTENEVLRCHAAFLFDLLIGNLDRHEENWMLGVDEQKRIARVVLIDNSNILPASIPYFYNQAAVKNSYAWKDLPIAARPVPEVIKTMFLKLLNNNPAKFVDDLFTMINEDPEIKGLISLESQGVLVKLGEEITKQNEKIIYDLQNEIKPLKSTINEKTKAKLHEMIEELVTEEAKDKVKEKPIYFSNDSKEQMRLRADRLYRRLTDLNLPNVTPQEIALPIKEVNYLRSKQKGVT